MNEDNQGIPQLSVLPSYIFEATLISKNTQETQMDVPRITKWGAILRVLTCGDQPRCASDIMAVDNLDNCYLTIFILRV